MYIIAKFSYTYYLLYNNKLHKKVIIIKHIK